MTGKPKILIVEDEPGVSMMMAYLLTQAGCEVQTTWHAERGMKLAQAGGFDLITLDLSLPGMNGFEICSRLKENPFFPTPIVFVSGQLGEDDVQYVLGLGAVDYIAKPFEATDFIFRIISCARVKTSCESVLATEKTVA